MHDDERRDHAGLDQQVTSELLSNPKALRARLDALEAGDRAARGKLKEAEKNARELKQLRAEMQDQLEA